KKRVIISYLKEFSMLFPFKFILYKKSPSSFLLGLQYIPAPTYSPTCYGSTIGSGGLNFSVRNGKRWTPPIYAPKYFKCYPVCLCLSLLGDRTGVGPLANNDILLKEVSWEEQTTVFCS